MRLYSHILVQWSLVVVAGNVRVSLAQDRHTKSHQQPNYRTHPKQADNPVADRLHGNDYQRSLHPDVIDSKNVRAQHTYEESYVQVRDQTYHIAIPKQRERPAHKSGKDGGSNAKESKNESERLQRIEDGAGNDLADFHSRYDDSSPPPPRNSRHHEQNLRISTKATTINNAENPTTNSRAKQTSARKPRNDTCGDFFSCPVDYMIKYWYFIIAGILVPMAIRLVWMCWKSNRDAKEREIKMNRAEKKLEQKEKEKRLLKSFQYLDEFNTDDVEIKPSAAGGLHGTFPSV